MLSGHGSRWCGLLFAGIAMAVFALPGVPDSPSPIHRSWETFTSADGLPHDRIRAIRIRDDQVWVGTDGGLALLDGNRGWTSWTSAEGLPWPVVGAIDLDPRTGDLWLGTWGGGLVRFSAGRFDRFDQFTSGLAGDLVFSVKVIDGVVWAATNGGLSSFDTIDDEWNLYAERRTDGPETVYTDLDGGSRGPYAAAWCEGLHRYDSHLDRWSRIDLSPTGAEDAQVRNGCATVLSVPAEGSSIWLANRTELLRGDGSGGWERRNIPGSIHGLVRGLAARNDREAWLGTENGLRILADWSTNTWLEFQDTDAEGPRLPDERVSCLAFAGDDIWVGTAGGLARGTNGRLFRGTGSGERQSPATREDTRGHAIGVLGPFTRPIALPGDATGSTRQRPRADRVAVKLAADQVNRSRAATSGSRVRVVIGLPEFTRHGWGTPEDDFVRFAYQDGVLGILGLFGPGNRIGPAVSWLTEVPLVNAASTAPAVEETVNPWIFRCPLNDPRQHEKFIDHLLGTWPEARVAVLRTPGSMEGLHLDWWMSRLRARGHPPVAVLPLDPEDDDRGPVVRELRRSEATLLLTWTGSDASAAILQGLRAAGMNQVFVGSDRIVNTEFVKRIGRNTGDIIAPYPCPHRADPNGAADFAREFASRGLDRKAAGPGAFLFYDATLHLAEAISAAGSDREAIRRKLDGMGTLIGARLEANRWRQVPLHEPPGQP